MFSKIKALFGVVKDPTLDVTADVDHVEVGNGFIILAMRVTWHNETSEPILIKGAQVKMFNSHKELEATFNYGGIFKRAPDQKAIDKLPRVESFDVRPERRVSACLRFFTRDINALPDGTYAGGFYSIVAEGAYAHKVQLIINSRNKYRTVEGWTEHAAGF